MLICHLRAHLVIVKIHKEKVFITQIGHHVVGFHIYMTIKKNIHRRRDALSKLQCIGAHRNWSYEPLYSRF